MQQIQGATASNLAANIDVPGDSVSINSVNTCLTGRHLLRRRRGLRSDGDAISAPQPATSSQQQQAPAIAYGTLAMTAQISWPKGSKIQTAEDVGK